MFNPRLRFTTEELRIKQGEFEGTRQSLENRVRKAEQERRAFVQQFPRSTIEDMTLSEYRVKSEARNSFCYLLETKLQGLGNMHGAGAKKFGIYFGKEKSDLAERYRWARRFGDNAALAFTNVKKAIAGLLDAGNRGDLAAIEANSLSPMFKGKILATYYPDKFLNIFAREHLEFFLDFWGIPYGENESEVGERQRLMDFKNSDAVMKSWTVYEFSEFLYVICSRPPRKGSVPKELAEYIEDPKEYPKLSEVKSEFISLQIRASSPESKEGQGAATRPPIDFEKEALIHKRLGRRGEEIVIASEKERLRAAGREDLAKRIEWASQQSDSLGYDILSFDGDGRVRRIEVKSTARSPKGTPSFLISRNQYRQARELENYYFYVVFEAKSAHPKIWPIKDPLQYEAKGLVLEPINFRVTINAETSGLASESVDKIVDAKSPKGIKIP
jgi:Protein NO VEIN, C-terminal